MKGKSPNPAMMSYSAAQGGSGPWRAPTTLEMRTNSSECFGTVRSCLQAKFCPGAISTEAVGTHQQHVHILNRSGNAFLNIYTSLQKYSQEKAVTAQHLYQLNKPSFPLEELRQNDC